MSSFESKLLTGVMHSPASEIGVYVVLWASPMSTMCETQQETPPSHICTCAKRHTLHFCTPTYLQWASEGFNWCNTLPTRNPRSHQLNLTNVKQANLRLKIYGSTCTPGTFAPTACMKAGRRCWLPEEPSWLPGSPERFDPARSLGTEQGQGDQPQHFLSCDAL